MGIIAARQRQRESCLKYVFDTARGSETLPVPVEVIENNVKLSYEEFESALAYLLKEELVASAEADATFVCHVFLTDKGAKYVEGSVSEHGAQGKPASIKVLV